MSKRLKRLMSLVLLVLPIFIVGSFFIFKTKITQATADASGPTQLQIAASDMQAAGFTSVVKQTPQASGRFPEPIDYFTTSDKVDGAQSEAPDLVMVDSASYPQSMSGGSLYTYGTGSYPFTIMGGQGQEGTMPDGRVAINFVKGNNYTVIIGPNKQKIEALANLVAQKIQ